MESVVHDDKEEKFKDDLRIFGYEMHNYIIARRLWHSNDPDTISITKNSEFTEEIGKAILEVWHDKVNEFRKMLVDDYPRYTERLENFCRYAMIRGKEIMNRTDFTNQQLMMVTAFLMELYCRCYEIHNDSFVPYFVEFWSALVLNLFSDTLNSTYDWQTLREECSKKSREYDENQVEKNLCIFGFTEIKIDYFHENLVTPNKDLKPVLREGYRCKAVSQFQIADEVTGEKILPHNWVVIPRDVTLNIISELGQKSHQEISNLMKPAATGVSAEVFIKEIAYQPENVSTKDKQQRRWRQKEQEGDRAVTKTRTKMKSGRFNVSTVKKSLTANELSADREKKMLKIESNKTVKCIHFFFPRVKVTLFN